MDRRLEQWRRVSYLGGELQSLTDQTVEELALNRARRDAWREFTRRWRNEWLNPPAAGNGATAPYSWRL